MGTKKVSKNETAVSRVVIMFFSFALLSALTWLYIIPFKKHQLVINNYYRYIEYAVMAGTLLLFICACVFSLLFKRREGDSSEKLFPPSSALILSFSAASAAAVIPLSHNRTLCAKYAVISYICIFAAYAVYYFISRAYAFQTIMCAIYCILLRMTDIFFASSLNFADMPLIGYRLYTVIMICVILFGLFISYLASKLFSGVRVWQTAVFAAVATASLIVRLFVLKYVLTVGICLLAAAYILLAVVEKKLSKQS